MLITSYQRIEESKESINKINVFPVPDQDTGNNLVKTLLGVKEVIENREFRNLEEISNTALDGSLTAAQGNAGVIYTGFLAGFLGALQGKGLADAKKLTQALRAGAKRARLSIQDPKEGTILDVIEAAASSFEKESRNERDIINLLKKAISKAHEALLATREKMEIFKKANVVDAGGMGYLIILESYLEALEGERREREEEIRPSEKIRRFVQTISHRYEVVFLIDKPKIKIEEMKKRLSKIGNSMEVLQIGDRVKTHIHTDEIDEVKKIARESGEIKNLRVEDMAKEVVGEESLRETSIGIVTDAITDLTPKIIERYQIETISFVIEWREGGELTGENIYQKMREADRRGIKTFPKTSQPSPRAYLDAFERQLEKFKQVLCITASSKLSGAYNSAKQAEEMMENPLPVFVFDSQNGSCGHALLVLYAIDLIQQGKEIGEVVSDLKKMINGVYTYVIFDDPKWVEAGGRLPSMLANWIRQFKKMGFYPLMSIKKGRVGPAGLTRAKSIGEALFKKIEKASQKSRAEGKRIRTVIGHADNLEEAQKLKKLLKERIKADVMYINIASPAIAAHAGPGTLIVGWMPI
ncbi:MAG: DegV family protein [Patescibacteria group bacterium]